MEIYPSSLIHLLDHPTFVDANKDQICNRVQATLETFKIFSDFCDSDQLEILTHLMYVEYIPSGYYSNGSNTLLRFVISGNCQVLRENGKERNVLRYTTDKWFTSFEQDSKPSTLLGLYTISDCIFVTLSCDVFLNFLDEYKLSDLQNLLNIKYKIF